MSAAFRAAPSWSRCCSRATRARLTTRPSSTALVQAAVDEAVRLQVASGVSVVSDGELGKVGYSTYVIERLSGFGGHSPRKPALDLAAVPELAKKLSHIMGSAGIHPRQPRSPKSSWSTSSRCTTISAASATALDRHGNGAAAFMNAASPGLITAFQPNQFYPSHEAYLADLVAAMRPEYEAIVAAGFQLQLDCPDLAMSRHTGYQDMSEAEFLTTIAANVEALNAATANIAPEAMRMHVCWGNYEGPHDFDIPLEKIIDVVLSARPATILFEAANPRHEHEWIVWKAADTSGKILAPGLVDSCSNYLETPELIAQRIERFAAFVGKDRVDRQLRLRLRHVRRLWQDRPGGGVEEARRAARRRRHRRREDRLMVDNAVSSQVKSATRTLDIIEYVVAHDRPLVAQEIAIALGIPVSSLSYLLGTLVERGYLARDGRRYSAGPGLQRLQARSGGFSLAERAAPLVRTLRVQLNETTSFFIRSAWDVEAIVTETSEQALRYAVPTGDAPADARVRLGQGAARGAVRRGARPLFRRNRARCASPPSTVTWEKALRTPDRADPQHGLLADRRGVQRSASAGLAGW